MLHKHLSKLCYQNFKCLNKSQCTVAEWTTSTGLSSNSLTDPGMEGRPALKVGLSSSIILLIPFEKILNVFIAWLVEDSMVKCQWTRAFLFSYFCMSERKK